MMFDFTVVFGFAVIAIVLLILAYRVMRLEEKVDSLRSEIEMLESLTETYYEHCYWAATDDLREKGRL